MVEQMHEMRVLTLSRFCRSAVNDKLKEEIAELHAFTQVRAGYIARVPAIRRD